MLRATVILALVCAAVAVNVLPDIRPLSGLSVSFSAELKSESDLMCKTCIKESVVMCVLQLFPSIFYKKIQTQSF